MNCHYIYPENILSYNGMYLFEKKIHTVNELPVHINIFASSRYILYINGEYVCEGPCRGHAKVKYYDSVDARLKKGNNDICVKVLHLPVGFTTVFSTPFPLLAFRAGCKEASFVSDASWSCKYLSGYRFRSEYPSLCHFESYNASGEAVDLKLAEIDEKCVFKSDGYFSEYGVANPFVMEKRPIPMIYPGEETVLKPVKSGDGFVEYDAGVYMTAKVKFDMARNSKVKILYSECYEFEDGKKVRDDTSGFLNGYYDEVVTAGEDMIYEPYWFRAFRFIRIEGDYDSVRSIKAYRVNYPLDIKSSFECSDESYNKMAEVCINTLRCCSHEIVVDCPFYEQQQYDMDSAIEHAVMMRMTDDRKLIRKCITDLAGSQNPNGLLCANYPSSLVQIIPGFSFFWIFLLRDYLENTGDVDFVSQFYGTIENILNYFDRQCSSNGYISESPYWDYLDWVPGWELGVVPLEKDEAHTVYNMYYACALKDAAFICEKTGREFLAKDYEVRYENIKNIINNLCFDEEKMMYRDGSKTRTFSTHTCIWAILSGVAQDDRRDILTEQIFNTDISKSSFSFNFYLFRALEESGHYDRAFGVLKDWQTMLSNHCTTWCENPDNPRSECHAWSCAPYYEFSRNILGVKIGFDDEITISPVPGKLTYARGTVPTRFGDLYVSWTYENGNFNIEVSGAQGVVKKIYTPDGRAFCIE